MCFQMMTLTAMRKFEGLPRAVGVIDVRSQWPCITLRGNAELDNEDVSGAGPSTDVRADQDREGVIHVVRLRAADETLTVEEHGGGA